MSGHERSAAGPNAAASEATQRRPLGTASLACLVVANMIGAGLFTTSGFALADLGAPSTVLIAWGVAGAIALMGAICYGGLAKQLTESGGEYLFLSRGVHPLAGFLAGWISLTAGFSGAIALAAVTFEEYLPAAIATPAAWPRHTAAMTLIVLFTALNLVGLRPASRAQNVLVLVKLVALVSLTLYGLAALLPPPPEMPEGAESFAIVTEIDLLDSVATIWPGLGVFATSLMWISFSYAGYNAAVYVAGSAKGAGRSVPRAMWIATLGVTALYLTLNAVFVYTAPPSDVAGQQDIAAIVARHLGGRPLEAAVRAVVLLALATSVSAMLQAGPHVYAQMARDGQLPGLLHRGHDTPHWGIILQAVLAAVLVWNHTFRQLLDYLGFLLSISSAATVACLFLPALRGQPKQRPVWLWPWLPAAFVSATCVVAGLALRHRLSSDPKGLLWALAVLPVGLLVFAAQQLWRRHRSG